MKKIILLILLFLPNLTNAQFKDIGIYGGVSFTNAAVSINPENIVFDEDKSIQLNYHVGIQSKFQLFNKVGIDAGLLFGQKSTEFGKSVLMKGLLINKVKNKYISAFVIGNYELIKNLQLGIGFEPTIFLENSYIGKTSFDIPIIAKLSYSLSFIEFALTYKHSFVNTPTRYIKSLYYRDLQLSLYVPLYKKLSNKIEN